MILPKLSAALLSMSFFGSAYACSDLHGNTSLDQWIVICGAANGAAATFHALPDELVLHYQTSKNHISRYATEKGMPALEFEPLFERGRIEGQRLISHRIQFFVPRQSTLLDGFHNDTHIDYPQVRRALEA